MTFTPVPAGYYRTPEWKAKSYECKRLRSFTCQACGTKYEPWEHWKLEAHHTPEAYQKVPHETPWDLLPLCGKRSGHRCHPKGRYTAQAVARDRKGMTWLWAIELLTLGPFRLAWWLLKRLLRGR